MKESLTGFTVHISDFWFILQANSEHINIKKRPTVTKTTHIIGCPAGICTDGPLVSQFDSSVSLFSHLSHRFLLLRLIRLH